MRAEEAWDPVCTGLGLGDPSAAGPGKGDAAVPSLHRGPGTQWDQQDLVESGYGRGQGDHPAPPELCAALHLSLQSLSLIRKHGLSAAIFAPGWVYEHLGEENFLQNENK